MNLFIELHETKFGTSERRFGTGWENLFTEQLAFFLNADLPAATDLAHLYLGDTKYVTKGVTVHPRLTQGVPDLKFEFDNGEFLNVEHKFDATLGNEQLERYLCDGMLALVSRSNQIIPPTVLADTKYLRPPDRHHFDWCDVYKALPNREKAPVGFGALRDYFRGYMRELGLAPSNLNQEWKRLFEDRTVDENQSVQKEFGRLLNPVMRAIREKEFRVGGVSHKGKQVYANSGSWWRHLYIQPGRVRADFLRACDTGPFDPGYEGLIVEIIADTTAKAFAWAVYEALCSSFTDSIGCRWYAVKPRPLQGKNRIRVAIATPLAPVLNQPEGLSRRLSASALDATERIISVAEAIPICKK